MKFATLRQKENPEKLDKRVHNGKTILKKHHKKAQRKYELRRLYQKRRSRTDCILQQNIVILIQSGLRS